MSKITELSQKHLEQLKLALKQSNDNVAALDQKKQEVAQQIQVIEQEIATWTEALEVK